MRKKNKIEKLIKENKVRWKRNLVYIKKNRVRSWKALLLIVFLVGGFSAVFLGVYYRIQTKSKAVANATLFFNPASMSATVGQTINLVARINPESNEVGGVELDISFNPAILKLNSVTRANTLNTTLSGPVIDNTAGTASIDVGLLTSPATYITTTSDVATFSFTVLAATTGSPVSFATTSNASTHGEYVVANRTSAQIIASAGSTVDTTIPTISITNPLNNTTISDIISFNVSASDNVGVSKVEFFIDGTSKYVDSSASYSYSLDTKNLTNASHTLSAKAYDAANNSATSAVTVTVKNADICTSFTYSDWGICQSDSTQTRTVLTSLPSDCTGGTPVVTQSCTPPVDPVNACTTFKYSRWSACVNNIRTRTVLSSKPEGCTGGNPVLSAACKSR